MIKMSHSCDIVLDNKFTVHLSINLNLGLILVNELDDFGDNWLEIKAVEKSKYELQYDAITITQGDDAIQAASRHFVDVIHKSLSKRAGPVHEQVGPLLKFILNVNLRPEVVANKRYVALVASALGTLVVSNSFNS